MTPTTNILHWCLFCGSVSLILRFPLSICLIIVPNGINSKSGEFEFGLAFIWQRKIFALLVYCKTSTSSQMWSNEQLWKEWMEINRSNDVVKLVLQPYFLPTFIRIQLLMFYCFSFNLQQLNVDGRVTSFLLVPK